MGTGVSAGNAPVIGTRGPDHIVGDGRANLLVGELGNDLIEGGANFDRLFGGRGLDIVRQTAASAELQKLWYLKFGPVPAPTPAG